VITGCNVDSGDDAIVLKSTSDRVCADVTVTGCVLRSTCNALKMGTESNGGFQNIVLTGCVIHDTRLAGVALEIVDGGTMDRVVVSGITMRGVGAPIFVRLGNRARPFKDGVDTPGIGTLRNVTISDIEAAAADPTGCAISGLPEAQIENLTLSNIRLSFAGGGTRADARPEIPEHPAKYPEYSMFGRLPAYGLYCRHVRGLRMTDVQLRTEATDERHAVVFHDVERVTLDGLTAASSKEAAAQVRLTDVKDVLIRGCMPPPGTDVFLKVQGPDVEGVTLVGNDFGGVEKIVEVDGNVAPTAVIKMANRMD
jgi:polygalacturonase